jgi:hypothetical protein
VFETRVLRRIFAPKRDDVTEEWRKLHSGELHNMFASPDIIRQIKPRSTIWAGHVAGMGEGGKVLVGNPEGKNHLKDEGLEGRMGSKWNSGKLAGG